MFLHENIKRLGLDMQSMAKTAENIQDAFQTLFKTSYVDQSQEVTQEQEQVKYFYKSSMEAFSAYAAHLSTTSKFFLLDQAKFYEYIALEGERIGQM